MTDPAYSSAENEKLASVPATDELDPMTLLSTNSVHEPVQAISKSAVYPTIDDGTTAVTGSHATSSPITFDACAALKPVTFALMQTV
jgi:hypothetical protein